MLTDDIGNAFCLYLFCIPIRLIFLLFLWRNPIDIMQLRVGDLMQKSFDILNLTHSFCYGNPFLCLMIIPMGLSRDIFGAIFLIARKKFG